MERLSVVKVSGALFGGLVPNQEGFLELATSRLSGPFLATPHGGRLSTGIAYACIVSCCVPVCVSFPSRLEPKGGGSVVCLSPKVATVYRAGQPRQSPLYRLVERYYPEFERTYDARYAKRYGP